MPEIGQCLVPACYLLQKFCKHQGFLAGYDGKQREGKSVNDTVLGVELDRVDDQRFILLRMKHPPRMSD